MVKFNDLEEKEKLYIVGSSLFAMNCIIYICLTYISYCFINYDFFHKTVPLSDFRQVIAPFSYCIMLLFLLCSYYVLDTEFEPAFVIFKVVGKIDFYVRFGVVIVTFILLKTTININNRVYLYMFLLVAFAFNYHLESNIRKTINKTSEVEIERIKNSNRITLSEKQAEKYKDALKKGKISFFVIACLIPFNSVLNNIFATFIFFFIYSTLVLHLLKNTYFLLYEKKKAIRNILVKIFIMLCGIILVLLLNEKIIVLNVYSFSKQELISLIGFFSFPLYVPTRKIYILLKQNNSL